MSSRALPSVVMLTMPVYKDGMVAGKQKRVQCGERMQGNDVSIGI
jgi:hypothetical protein